MDVKGKFPFKPATPPVFGSLSEYTCSLAYIFSYSCKKKTFSVELKISYCYFVKLYFETTLFVFFMFSDDFKSVKIILMGL